jgi:hypothetical protein
MWLKRKLRNGRLVDLVEIEDKDVLEELKKILKKDTLLAARDDRGNNILVAIDEIEGEPIGV